MSIVWWQWLVAGAAFGGRRLLAPGWITLSMVVKVWPFVALLVPPVVAGYLVSPGITPWLVSADVLLLAYLLVMPDTDDADVILPLMRLVGRRYGPREWTGVFEWAGRGLLVAYALMLAGVYLAVALG
ncbi:hypothetical protein ABZ319_40160 [Nocardia sp. NPDC005978]|uniref:hypothetical protein n=1 Tax=Nocardia sp. NPDC005978 TaxID=3156725 RepID=UPI0033B86EB2